MRFEARQNASIINKNTNPTTEKPNVVKRTTQNRMMLDYITLMFPKIASIEIEWARIYQCS